MIEFLTVRRFNHIDMLGSCAVAYALFHGQYALAVAGAFLGTAISVGFDHAIARLRAGKSE